MKVEIKYIFECKGGFKFTRDTFEEIKQIADENYNALRDMASNGDSVNMTMDYTSKYFPKASISACIDGTWKFYELRTEVKEIKHDIMTKEIYKGVEIRKYGTKPGESVYPICFTADLSERGQVKMHDSWEDARKYIDLYS